ncbi:FUSC family protein [Micromonospora echinospora]|uniref:FUSC family protein n=1 Tax=Micromonospora echinospora TaxID=1877 RepID=UPI003A88B801
MRHAPARLRDRAHQVRRDAFRRLQTYSIIAVQAGVAAALAWVAARELLGNPDSTFAPAAAVGVIAASLRHRARRTTELVVGVVLGIAVGDLLIFGVGTGPWQTAVIVFLAITAATLVRGTGALMTQAGGTAVLVATLTPTAPDLELARTANAVVGGIVGLLVVLLLVPLNPLRTVRRVADPALDAFAREMTASARALTARDARAAEEVLDRMRAAEGELDRLDEVVDAAMEVVRYSPCAGVTAGSWPPTSTARSTWTGPSATADPWSAGSAPSCATGRPCRPSCPPPSNASARRSGCCTASSSPGTSRRAPGNACSTRSGTRVPRAGRTSASPAPSSSRSSAPPPTTCSGRPGCPAPQPAGRSARPPPATRADPGRPGASRR